MNPQGKVAPESSANLYQFKEGFGLSTKLKTMFSVAVEGFHLKFMNRWENCVWPWKQSLVDLKITPPSGWAALVWAWTDLFAV